MASKGLISVHSYLELFSFIVLIIIVIKEVFKYSLASCLSQIASKLTNTSDSGNLSFVLHCVPRLSTAWQRIVTQKYT